MTLAPEKKKWPAPLAKRVALGIMSPLAQVCEPGRLCVAGSMRRGKDEVGDIEILYVSRIGQVQKPGEMFESQGSLADMLIDDLRRGGKLDKRQNINGQFTWGAQNKLAIHKATDLPVDFFSTTEENWFVSLVIRTGPKDFNIGLIQNAKRRGLQLHAYGAYTEIGTGLPIYPKSEREVLELAGLPWIPPEERT